jgi:hypothetical protein
MCKNSTNLSNQIPSLASIKLTAQLYRRKLALKIKENLENNTITD